MRPILMRPGERERVAVAGSGAPSRGGCSGSGGAALGFAAFELARTIAGVLRGSVSGSGGVAAGVARTFTGAGTGC